MTCELWSIQSVDQVVMAVRCLLHRHCMIKRWNLCLSRCSVHWISLLMGMCYIFIHDSCSVKQMLLGTYMLGWCGKGIRIILNRVAILDSWNCSLVRLGAYYQDAIICCTSVNIAFQALLWLVSSAIQANHFCLFWFCEAVTMTATKSVIEWY